MCIERHLVLHQSSASVQKGVWRPPSWLFQSLCKRTEKTNLKVSKGIAHGTLLLDIKK